MPSFITLPLFLLLLLVTQHALGDDFCKRLAHKLRTVIHSGCLALELRPSGAVSVEGLPIMERRVRPDTSGHPRVLFLAGIHGDEWASVSLAYLWLQILIEQQPQLHHDWLVVPVVNPDGLFRRPSHRTNAHGVDLNRNFPSPDWPTHAHAWWHRFKRDNPRYYPGPAAASEPETRHVIRLIRDFQPHVIIALHAPFRLLDYDGPNHLTLPKKLGPLKLRQLGTYPGSLGRYAGEYLHIPVLTIELANAARMPTRRQIRAMWQDLENWLHQAHAPLGKPALHAIKTP